MNNAEAYRAIKPDAALSLRWEPPNHWRAINTALGCSERSRTAAAVAVALVIEALGQGRRVSYSRNRNHYAVPRRYRDPLYTYSSVVAAANFLDAAGLVDHRKASPGNLGWQSTMRARPELVDLIGSILETELYLRRPPEPVILRGTDHRSRNYRDTRTTCRMRREVAEQNEAIAAARFGGENVVSFVAPLRRIFSGGFDSGGRFYAEGGGWQRMPKEERLRIEIDGEAVVEIDYSQFHPALAYAQVGHPPPPDAYEVVSFPREAGKVAFNVMLNSSGRPGARWTLAHDHTELILGQLLRTERSFQDTLAVADRLIDALLAKHQPIAAVFFTGAGLSLQRLDSDIAAAVMTEMRRRGGVVLPIHNSFLAPVSKAAELEQVMVDQAVRFGAALTCKCSASVPVG